MCIKPTTTFLAFDFETTGLDTKKDEPIQIGIVRADSQFNILDTYTSLIKPKKNIKELKGIVQRITGLSFDQLADAPTMEDILPDIRDWFDEDAIVVGHNIKFDIAMMQPFLPDWKPTKLFDTFDRSQVLMHYPASFALEALWNKITPAYAKQPFSFLNSTTRDHTLESHHDALYDSFTSLALARHLIEKMQRIETSHPWMSKITTQHSLLCDIFDNSESNAPISLPILNKPISKEARDLTPHTPVVDFRSLPGNKTRFSGQVSLEDMLLSAVANKPIIIATHTGQKLDIVKNTLARHGYNDIGYAKPEQHIDYDAFTALIGKDNLSNDIIQFTLKYLSHDEQGLRVLQLLRDDERAIFDAIKKTTDRLHKDIILCSHGGLYWMIEQGLYPDYEILYLDADWWYHSYNRFRSVSFDPYKSLNGLERIHRAYEIRQQISPQEKQSIITEKLATIINECMLFVGTIGIDTNQVFQGRGSDKIETGPINSQSDWSRTAGAWQSLRSHLDEILAIEEIEDRATIQQLRDHLEIICNELVTIYRGARDREYMHYTYQTTYDYSDFSEFMGIFDGRHAVITSHVRTTNNAIVSLPDQNYVAPHFVNTPAPAQLMREIENTDPDTSKTFFAISSSKNASQKLFEKIQTDSRFASYQLIVDNITGSTAKNTHKAKQAGPKIIIGGYYFYLNLIAKNIDIDMFMVYALGGKMKPLILGDVDYYS